MGSCLSRGFEPGSVAGLPCVPGVLFKLIILTTHTSHRALCTIDPSGFLCLEEENGSASLKDFNADIDEQDWDWECFPNTTICILKVGTWPRNCLKLDGDAATRVKVLDCMDGELQFWWVERYVLEEL